MVATVVSNEAQPHSNGARNERSPKNQCENDEVHAFHVPHFPLFLFLRLGAVLDDPKPHDDFADPDHQGDRKSKQDTKAILNAGAEIEEESSLSGMNCRTKKRPKKLLGLRSKGPVDGKLLEKNYRERLKNYSPSN